MRYPSHTKHARKQAAILSALGLLLLCLGGIAHAGRNCRCHTASVATEIVLPDGSVHAPGQLKICLDKHGVGLHTAAVDGAAVGMFASRQVENDESPKVEGVVFIFAPTQTEDLFLKGYTLKRGDHVKTYRLNPTRKFSRRAEHDPRLHVRNAADTFSLIAVGPTTR